MTKEFEAMLALFRAGAKGSACHLPEDINLQGVLKHASNQGILHLLFPGIKALSEKEPNRLPEGLFAALQHSVFTAVMKNTQRQTLLHQVYARFQKEGISFCLLKGETVSCLYHNPELRISGDTDIFVAPSDRKKALSILKEFGFTQEPVPPTSHHMHLTHPVGGLIELHRRLHDELFEEVWFDNKMGLDEPYRMIKVTDQKMVPTLGVTDGVIFLALHYIKHFLSCGAGVRQMMDLLFYIQKYKEEIDWKRFFDLTDYLQYTKFIHQIFGIGVDYLGFSTEDFPAFHYDKALSEKILSDTEQGGIFGKGEEGREQFYMVYTKARFERFQGKAFTKYIRSWRNKNLKIFLFPSPKTLIPRYGYLKKSILLYPIAWVHRLIDFIFSGDESKKTAVFSPEGISSSKEITETRMELIRQLDMI